MSNRFSGGIVATLCLLFAAGCGDDLNEPTPNLPNVAVRPSALRLGEGSTTQLVVTLAPGLAGSSVSWSSSNPAVAQVSASGLVTGLQPGVATITASTGTDSGAAVVNVVRTDCRLFYPCDES